MTLMKTLKKRGKGRESDIDEDSDVEDIKKGKEERDERY